MFTDLIKLILKDIKRRKVSSFLTFFAISLGILTIFLIILLSIGFENSVKSEFESLGVNRLYVSSTGSNFGSSDAGISLTESDVEYIENRAYVEEAYPYKGESVSLRFGNDFEQKTIYGVEFTEEFFEVLTYEMEEGRFPRQEKFGAIIGPRAAKLPKINPNTAPKNP